MGSELPVLHPFIRSSGALREPPIKSGLSAGATYNGSMLSKSKLCPTAADLELTAALPEDDDAAVTVLFATFFMPALFTTDRLPVIFIELDAVVA